MEDKPLLIYPVYSDAEFNVEFVPVEHVPGRHIRHFFERSIIVENISDDSDDEVYQKLRISDESVLSMKFIPGTRENRRRVIITYRSADEAKAAALEYDQTPKYPNICAIVVVDFLRKLKETEDKISSKSSVKDQDQVLKFKTDKMQFSEVKFQHRLTDLFSRVSSEFLIYIQSFEPHGEALVQVSSLSEALAAEIAFWGKKHYWGTMEVRIARHPVYIKHDLDVRLSLIGHPKEARLVLQKALGEDNAHSVAQFTAFNPLICKNCIMKAEMMNSQNP